MNLQYDNYVFDVYGTLIDLESDEVSPRTWKKWMKYLDQKEIKHPIYYEFRNDFFNMDRQFRKDEFAKGNCEVPEIEILDVYRILFDKYGNGILSDETLNEISYAFREASRSYIRLYPDVENYLIQLRNENKKLYILSNAQASYTKPELKMFQLDQLTDGYLLSSDYKKMKPDQGFFDAIITEYHLDPNKTVMIGDSYSSDIAGAMKVGFSTIHLKGVNDAKSFYTKEISD